MMARYGFSVDFFLKNSEMKTLIFVKVNVREHATAILTLTSLIDIFMCQSDAHWFLKQKMLLFHSLQI